MTITTAEQAAEALREKLGPGFTVEPHTVRVDVSIGPHRWLVAEARMGPAGRSLLHAPATSWDDAIRIAQERIPADVRAYRDALAAEVVALDAALAALPVVESPVETDAYAAALEYVAAMGLTLAADAAVGDLVWVVGPDWSKPATVTEVRDKGAFARSECGTLYTTWELPLAVRAPRFKPCEPPTDSEMEDPRFVDVMYRLGFGDIDNHQAVAELATLRGEP